MKELIELILHLETILLNYEEGDLLKLLDIKDSSAEIDNILSKNKELACLIDSDLSQKVASMNEGDLVDILPPLREHINEIKLFVESI
ncbi:MAG TPA: hypothetical protein PLI57_11950, partial [Spirochaetota bacterium]|nr:hypothetical protein [Spirochaetota bacterium]